MQKVDDDGCTVDWRPAFRFALHNGGQQQLIATLQTAVEHELHAFKEEQCAAFRAAIERERATFLHELAKIKDEVASQLAAVEAENATLRRELMAARAELSHLRPNNQQLH